MHGIRWLAVTLSCLGAVSTAVAQPPPLSISLDGTYDGYFRIVPTTPYFIDMLFRGDNTAPGADIESLALFAEANLFQFPDYLDMPRATFRTPDGEWLAGPFWFDPGADTNSGGFEIDEGTGRFAGARGGGTFTLERGVTDRVTVHGSAAVIPEPASLALMLGGLGALALRRKRPSPTGRTLGNGVHECVA